MKKIIRTALLATLVLATSQAALASKAKCHCKHKHNEEAVATAPVDFKGEATPVHTANYSWLSTWYAGANVGESRTHDKPAAGTADSVTQIGPGWSVDLGYQFLEFYRATLAAELGYTQYYNSNETLPGVNKASTAHFASYLAAVVQYPLVYNFNILGKLGYAYSYAKKVFTTSGVSASANANSLYWGLGFSYDMTKQAALVLQWDRARGNSKTGSTDLTSLGVSYSFM